ncbi:MAG: hypothetical protein ACK4K9_08300 [Bacteroidia bacterium]
MNQTEEIREKHRTKVASFMYYFNLAMGVFYLIAALLIYFYPPQVLTVSDNSRLIISLVLAIYGFIRIFRSLKKQ